MASDWIAAQISEPGSDGTGEHGRRKVSANLTAASAPSGVSGRRLPFYWWKGADGAASWYAMKPLVAALFREARQQAGPGSADAAPGSDWSDAEVAATVDDYLAMLTTEAAGQQYSKAAHRRELSQRLSASRTASAIEFKHQNISAAMIELGLPYIRGYRPMGNYQAALSAEIQRRLDADPRLLGRLRAGTEALTPGSQLQRTDPPRRAAGNRGRTTGGDRAGRHPDYGLLQEENSKRGALGEQLVVGYERRWLREQGRGDLAGRVRWTASEDGDGLGYDVLSYDTDGHVRHIEVKTTALGAEAPFYISSAELEFARSHLASYALYRVYAVLLATPRFFVLEGNDALQLELTPVTYRACLPAQIPAGEDRQSKAGAPTIQNAAHGLS